jgi:hypothetical protein
MTDIPNKQKSLQEKFLSRKPIYLLDDFEEIVFRWDPEKDIWFAKRKNKEEYQISQDTTLVTEALISGKEITKPDYEFY